MPEGSAVRRRQTWRRFLHLLHFYRSEFYVFTAGKQDSNYMSIVVSNREVYSSKVIRSRLFRPARLCPKSLHPARTTSARFAPEKPRQLATFPFRRINIYKFSLFRHDFYAVLMLACSLAFFLIAGIVYMYADR